MEMLIERSWMVEVKKMSQMIVKLLLLFLSEFGYRMMKARQEEFQEQKLKAQYQKSYKSVERVMEAYAVLQGS
jgi:hypothetical protein